MHQAKEPDPLIEARQLFRKEQYQQSKAKLESIKQSNQNIDLNLFLTEHKINPANSDIVLKALMDRLTEIGIKLYKDMGELIKHKKTNKNPIKHISHEFYYWNIIVIAQQIGKPSISSLMGKQALEFSSCFRSQTALMIIYEMLKQMVCENRLATSGTLVMKFQEIIENAKQLSTQQQIYRVMNHIMWTRIFLRLGFLDQSTQLYKSKLNKAEEQLFDSFKNLLPLEIYREFLHAEIEYFRQNYNGSLQILGQILSNVEKNDQIEKGTRQKITNMIESNVAAIFMNMGKVSIGRKLLAKTNQFFRKACYEGIDNERYLTFERSKELLLYSFLQSKGGKMKKEDCSRAFHLMNRTQSNKSYKLFYRKGQLCVQCIHNLIRQEQSTLPYKEIVDNFDCSYFYINDPYFQSKGKNKNLTYSQGKRYYRRYIVKEWDTNGNENKKHEQSTESLQGNSSVNNGKINDVSEQDMSSGDVKTLNKSQDILNIDEKPDKKKRKASSNVATQETNKDKKTFKDLADEETQGKKGTKSESKDKENDLKGTLNAKKDEQLSQLAFKAITYFKQSLFLLEEQKKVILTFKADEIDLTERVNLKIYDEYRVFKQSILMNLCYMYLLRQNWTKVIQQAEMYRKFVAYDKQSNSFEAQNIKKAYNQQEYFSVLSYELEAYCQINKFTKAYETMQDIVQLGYSQTACFEACSSINLNPRYCFIEQANQYHNLLYNISILHMRDNHLPQAHQALQKILTETNILPNRSSFKTPLSVNDLLLHYHLRTGDRISALQILKRRRVMGMAGVNGVYNVLKITK